MVFFKTKDGENKFVVYWLEIGAGVIAVTTLVGLRFYPENGHWHGVLEAFFIAAVLCLTVDPFVKKRLAHEASKDIFYYILGFQLPKDMQDRLHKYLRDLKYYRESLSITVKALRIEGEEVVLEVTQVSHIIALTKCDYHQRLTFEDPEHGQVSEMWAKRPGSTEKLVEWIASKSLAEQPEPLTTLYQNPIAKLRGGDKLEAFFKFTLRGRKADYWSQKFGTTTLKTDVTLLPLDGMQLFASELGDAPIGKKLEYDHVFIVGDDLHIRWKVPDGQMMSAQEVPPKVVPA